MLKKMKIFAGRNCKNILKVLRQMHVFTVAVPKQAQILWVRKHYRPWFKLLADDQYINHFPNDGCLANKGRLYTSLQNYGKQNSNLPIKCEDFLPQSYNLTDDEEREAFLAQIPEEDSIENLWIMKPANMSEGAGVKIKWQLSKLKNMIDRNKGKMPFQKRGRIAYIAQKYLKNPLLLNERKSDIRIYWLLASLDPLMILMFNQGVVRVNTLPFALDDFGNQLVHVTNPYKNTKHRDYDPDAVLRWNFDELQDYLLKTNKVDNPNYVTEDFLAGCHKIIHYVVEANRENLRKNITHGNCYSLYGADIMLDDNLQPWLAEIQKGPSLDITGPIKKNVVPPMLYEMFNIMNEICQRKKNNQSLQQLDAVRNFQWVINEAE